MSKEVLSVNWMGNCYGTLNIKEEGGKYYWIIENYDTDFSNLNQWDEIPESLYKEIEKHIKDNE